MTEYTEQGVQGVVRSIDYGVPGQVPTFVRVELARANQCPALSATVWVKWREPLTPYGRAVELLRGRLGASNHEAEAIARALDDAELLRDQDPLVDTEEHPPFRSVTIERAGKPIEGHDPTPPGVEPVWFTDNAWLNRGAVCFKDKDGRHWTLEPGLSCDWPNEVRDQAQRALMGLVNPPIPQTGKLTTRLRHIKGRLAEEHPGTLVGENLSDRDLLHILQTLDAILLEDSGA